MCRPAALPPIDPHVIVLFGATGDLARRKLLPGLLHLSQAKLISGPRGRRRLARAHERPGVPRVREAELRKLARHPVSPDELEEFAARLSYVDKSAGPEGSPTPSACRGHARRRASPAVPPERPPGAAIDVIREIGEAGLAERARVIMEKPFGTDLASAVGSTTRSTRSSTRTRFSASTTSWARRRPRTSSRCGSLTASSSQFGTATTSTTSRSTFPRRPTSAPASSSTETGAYRDMVVTHFVSRCSGSSQWSRRRRSPRADQRGEEQGFPLTAIHRRQQGRARTVRELPLSSRVDPNSQTETFVALGAASTTGAGPAFRSTCEPASEWPRTRGSSRSRFASLRRACSPTVRASASTAPTTSRSTSTRPPASPALFLWQAPRADDDARQAQHAVLAVRGPARGRAPKAYERLIRDAMYGDRTLFTSAAGIERLWTVSAPLSRTREVLPYPTGSWGPEAIHELIAPRKWRLPFERRWREPKVTYA